MEAGCRDLETEAEAEAEAEATLSDLDMTPPSPLPLFLSHSLPPSLTCLFFSLSLVGDKREGFAQSGKLEDIRMN